MLNWVFPRVSIQYYMYILLNKSPVRLISIRIISALHLLMYCHVSELCLWAKMMNNWILKWIKPSLITYRIFCMPIIISYIFPAILRDKLERIFQYFEEHVIYILVLLGYYNKLLQTGCLFLTILVWKVQDQGAVRVGFGEGFLPGL